MNLYEMNLKYLRFLANKIVKMDNSMLLIALDVISIVITVGQYILPCIMLDKFVIYDASSFAFNQGTLVWIHCFP